MPLFLLCIIQLICITLEQWTSLGLTILDCHSPPPFPIILSLRNIYHPHCLSFPLSIISIVCHFQLSVIPHCISFPTVCHSQFLFAIVCHSPLSVIHHCLLYPIVYHSTHLHNLRTIDHSQHAVHMITWPCDDNKQNKNGYLTTTYSSPFSTGGKSLI